MICPCKNCTKRWVSETSRCHSSCKEYKEWSEIARQQKELFVKRRAAFNSVGDVLFHRKRKS